MADVASTKSALVNDTSVLYDSPNAKYDQCDYTLLFSHLPASFAHLSQFQVQQFSLNSNPSSSSSTSANSVEQQYAVQKLCYALVALCFGLFYSLIGYRFLKLSTFIIGFSLGSSIIYLILAEQKQLTVVENLIISLSIGCLFAFVALLVQYIGLFLLGITSSISIVTCILILIDLFHTNKSAWLCILLMFTCATLVASITLKFQKSLTIFNTSAIGAGLLLISIDYFVENNLLLDYIYELYKVNGNSFNIFERQRALLKGSDDLGGSNGVSKVTQRVLTVATTKFLNNNNNSTSSINKLGSSNSTSVDGNSNSALALFLHLYSSAHARLCWYTWLIFGIYFILLVSSILVQYLITGKNYDHRDSWQKLIRGSRKKRSANLEKIRLKSHLNETSSSHHHHHHHNNQNDHHRSHHHHHHSKNHQQNTTSNSTSATTTDRLSLSAQSIDSQNDTLLLVTNELNTNLTTTLTTSNNSDNNNINNNNNHSVSPHNKKKRQHKTKTTGSKNTDLEIVSFEVIKSPKKESQHPKRSSNGSSNNNRSSAAVPISHHSKNQQQKSQQTQLINTANSISTTTSTSSSASSTCQLIPPKPEPSAPPLYIQPTVTNTNSNQQPQQQQPPPVPSLPPPKLPPLFAATTALASSTASSQQPHQIMTPLQTNLAKIKQHRSSSSNSSNNMGDKFRYFYQVRRNNGDVLSQDFMNNFHNKLQSSTNLNTNESDQRLSGSSGTSSGGGQTSSLNSSDNNKKKRRSSSSKSKS